MVMCFIWIIFHEPVKTFLLTVKLICIAMPMLMIMQSRTKKMRQSSQMILWEQSQLCHLQQIISETREYQTASQYIHTQIAWSWDWFMVDMSDLGGLLRWKWTHRQIWSPWGQLSSVLLVTSFIYQYIGRFGRSEKQEQGNIWHKLS